MGTVEYLSGPETREAVRNASGPMRSTGLPGAGELESQCERVGEVVARLLEGLTVSDTHHGNVTGVCKSCGENV